MKSWQQPTPETIDRVLASTKKETDRQYFFTRLKNPLWLPEIVARGYFQSPPGALRLADGSLQYPYWPELEYLKNIAPEVPDEVVAVILKIPKVVNPGVDVGILKTVLELPGQHSVKLKERVIQCAKTFPEHLYYTISEVLNYWLEQNEVHAALELAGVLVKFAPDPASDEKQKRRRENPEDFSTMLRPSPAFDDDGYQTLLNEEVRKLLEQEPYSVSLLLLDATEEMISLSTHFDSETAADPFRGLVSKAECREMDPRVCET